MKSHLHATSGVEIASKLDGTHNSDGEVRFDSQGYGILVRVLPMVQNRSYKADDANCVSSDNSFTQNEARNYSNGSRKKNESGNISTLLVLNTVENKTAFSIV
jgi:hypothetical protein